MKWVGIDIYVFVFNYVNINVFKIVYTNVFVCIYVYIFDYTMKKIAFTVEKGGNLKTTSTINIGYALANLGYKVGLIDMDLQRHLAICLDSRGGSDVATCLRRGSTLTMDDFAETSHKDLYLLPNKGDIDSKLYGELEKEDPFARFYALNTLLEGCDIFDFMLIDTPPSLDLPTINSILASDYVLIPTRLEVLPITGVQNTIQAIKKIQGKQAPDLKILGILVGSVDNRLADNDVLMQELKNIAGDVPILDSVIRTNSNIPKSQKYSQSVYEARDVKASLDFTMVAKEIARRINNQ